MMENSPIKKMANSVLRGRKHAIFDRKIMHPEREWFLGILVATGFLIFGVVWNINTYLNFSNITVTGSNDMGQKVAYKQALVETALTDISDRNKIYEELKADLIRKNKGREVIPETVILEEESVTIDESASISTQESIIPSEEMSF